MEENFLSLIKCKHTHTRFIKDLLFFELREKLSLSVCVFLSLSFQALFFGLNVNAKQQGKHNLTLLQM